MPFTCRDKPKLADRLRGKSGEEILNELKSDLDPQKRRMFFDSPSWRTRQNNSGFPRGFPFDDDRNRINIRTYLDEIAARHPEFADQLREPSWREDFVDPSYHQADTFSENQQGSETQAETSGAHQVPAEAKEPQATLTNFGLRNTVPLGPGANLEDNRHQRSMSAPPENRSAEKTKRFVTKCEIPVMNNPIQDSVQMKPELPGKGGLEPPQQKANNAPNVRVIPIQVEGRDTPIVNANVDTSTNFGSEAFHDQSFEGRLPRDFGSYQRHSPRFAHKERTPSPTPYQYAPQFQQYAPSGPHFGPSPAPQFMPQQRFAPPQPQPFAPQQQHPQKPPAPPPMYRQGPQQFQQHHPQQQQQQQRQQQQQQHHQQQQQQQHHQQHQQQEPKLPQEGEINSKLPHPPKPEPPKDPIEKVEAIQKEVDKLMEQVKAFQGTSRTDKQYLMLDELLTRQLILLDNIETEGKENVRQARKDTIHSIQRCISLLENKVPVAENVNASMESNENQNDQNVKESGGPQGMEVEVPQDLSVEKKVQKMDVDEKVSEGVQGAQQQPQNQETLQSQQPTQQQVSKEESKEKV